MNLKNLLKKKKSSIIFLKRLKKFIFYKFNIKRIYLKYFSSFRIFFFKRNFIPFNLKLNLIKGDDFKLLKDKDFKQFHNIKNISELSSCFIKLAKKDKNIEENLIKASWCIALKEDKLFNIEYLLNQLELININSTKYYSLLYSLSLPFIYKGDYFRFEKIQKNLRFLLDKKNNQRLSLKNENQHFTAIGHLSYVFFLIKAVNTKIIDPTQTPISLIYDKQKVANIEYANLIAELCPTYGISIINPSNIREDQYRPNLELWPSFEKQEYLIARNFHGLAYSEKRSIRKTLFLKPKKHHLEVAQQIIKKYLLPIDKWFVGMHLRYARDGEELRNPSPEIFQQTIDFINKKGGKVVLVGSKKNKIYSSLNSVIDTTKLPINRYERECLGIYIWSNSKFFIGCLSGGSYPPTTFGVKTLWLDINPTLPTRPPNEDDICLPKRIFFKPENRYLSFDEANSRKHYISQTEFPEVAEKYGYEVKSVTFDLVKETLEELIYGRININPIRKEEDHPIPFGAKIYTKKI